MNAGINECETGAADCAPDATCFDTPGSFECRCNEGFEGDGRTGCTPAMLGEFHLASYPGPLRISFIISSIFTQCPA